MEAEEFNYYFEHGEFMPISAKKIREARNDDTIERPARHISMTDGYAEEKSRGDAPSDGIADAPEATAPQDDAPRAANPQDDSPKGE